MGRPWAAGLAAWPVKTHPRTSSPDKLTPNRRNRAAVPFIILTPWVARKAIEFRAVPTNIPSCNASFLLSGAKIWINEIESSLWHFPDLHARIANGKWTQTSHRLAGLAVILLFIQDANNGFPKEPIELAF